MRWFMVSTRKKSLNGFNLTNVRLINLLYNGCLTIGWALTPR